MSNANGRDFVGRGGLLQQVLRSRYAFNDNSKGDCRFVTNLCKIWFPHSLKSDNGPQFVSEDFQKYLLENGIEHRKSPALWPQANGEVERQNRTLLKALKVAEAEGKKWQEELPKFLLAYRSTPQVSTGATPAYLMFGRELKTKLPELRRQDSILNQTTKERDWRQKLSQKAYADEKNRASTNPVAPGDQVLLKNTKTTGKLAPNYEKEPYTVLTKEGHELMLKSKDGGIYRRDSSFVKPFNPPEEVDLPLTVNLPSEGEQVTSEELSEKPLDTVIEHARPKRVTRLPNKFKDYVVEKAK